MYSPMTVLGGGGAHTSTFRFRHFQLFNNSGMIICYVNILVDLKSEVRSFNFCMDQLLECVQWVRRRRSSHLQEQEIPDTQELLGANIY